MKKIKPFILFWLMCNLTLILTNVQANQSKSHQNAPIETKTVIYQSLDAIYKLVTKHVKQKIDQKIFNPVIQLRKLSPDLKLTKCLTPLQLADNNLENVAGRMTISVFCNKPNWRVFVPVTVEGKQPVVISTHGILKRAVIKEGDVHQVLLNYKRIPPGGMIDPNKVIGMRTKKAIAPNSVVKVRDLQPPYWVFKKKQVTIITHIGGIEVQTKGTALNNAVEDEQVRVKNNTSKKVIKGIVIAPNTVLVP